MEVGPYRLASDDSLVYNEGSWDEFANLLFVDQPVGTGFSYVNTDSYIHELDDMAAQFVVFLESFFEVFPEYERDDVCSHSRRENNEFKFTDVPLQIYFAGESFAGQHIPYIVKAINARNLGAKMDKARRPWNVRGLLIGNGWISPPEQYASFLPFAYKEGLVKEGTSEARDLERLQSSCFSRLEEPGSRNKISIQQCDAVLQALLQRDSKNECYNMYDIRLRDSYPSCGMNWPPDLKNINPYLRRPDVVQALNINPDKKSGWEECAGSVTSQFTALNSVPSVQLLPELLESGIPVLLFAGDKDLICDHLGIEQMIHNMKWGGGTGFETSPGVWAPRQEWTFEGEPAGIYQSARNLTYALLYNASHMSPYEIPRQTRDMLDRFMKVDIASIGGSPTDSRINGEKVPPTAVGAHPNSTAAEQEELEKMKEAEWQAYTKSGETALVVVVIGVSVWGFFIWRSRRRHAGYGSLFSHPPPSPYHSSKRSGPSDVEAGHFDESELDRLDSSGRGYDEEEHYAVGIDSDEEQDQGNDHHHESHT